MKIFILEDDYTRRAMFNEVLAGHEVFIAEEIDQAKIVYEANKPFDLLLLDHDLDERFMHEGEANTGYSFVKWLVKTKQDHVKEVVIHSYNPEGAKRMEQALKDDGWMHVGRVPFGMTLLRSLEVVAKRA